MNTTLKYCNRGGIPCMKSESAVVSGTTLTITFPSYQNPLKGFSGLAIMNVAQSFTSTGLTAINVVIEGRVYPLTASTGVAAAAADMSAYGIYPVFMDRAAGTIQLV